MVQAASQRLKPKRKYILPEGAISAWPCSLLLTTKQPYAKAETDDDKKAGSQKLVGMTSAMTLPQLELTDKATPLTGLSEQYRQWDCLWQLHSWAHSQHCYMLCIQTQFKISRRWVITEPHTCCTYKCEQVHLCIYMHTLTSATHAELYFSSLVTFRFSKIAHAS